MQCKALLYREEIVNSINQSKTGLRVDLRSWGEMPKIPIKINPAQRRGNIVDFARSIQLDIGLTGYQPIASRLRLTGGVRCDQTTGHAAAGTGAGPHPPAAPRSPLGRTRARSVAWPLDARLGGHRWPDRRRRLNPRAAARAPRLTVCNGPSLNGCV